MELSAKMPATMNATQDARMPAQRESKAPSVGGGSPEPQGGPMSQQNSGGVGWDAKAAGTQGWEAQERKNAPGWETADRKE